MKRVEVQPILPAEGMSFWRASDYGVVGGFLEAAAGATWERVAPEYWPAGKRREPEAGPYLSFMRLRSMLDGGSWEDLADLYGGNALAVFAGEYGLLGLMHDDYLMPPVPPSGKPFIACEAVIGDGGELQRVDPAGEGTALVLDLLSRLPGWASMVARRYGEDPASLVALPSEASVVPRIYAGPWPDPHRAGLDPVSWEDAQEPYGALLTLDEDSPTRASVLCTREPLPGWWRALEDFPSREGGEYRPEDASLKRYLNSLLTDVSPYSPEGMDEFGRGWRCRTLLQAMHLMLWLDLTGGRSVRECGLRDCHNHFRVGSQPSALYCSARHASLAATRRNLGQEP